MNHILNSWERRFRASKFVTITWPDEDALNTATGDIMDASRILMQSLDSDQKGAFQEEAQCMRHFQNLSFRYYFAAGYNMGYEDALNGRKRPENPKTADAEQ